MKARPAASTGSDLNGWAAYDAANTIKQRMIGLAVEQFGVAAGHVRVGRQFPRKRGEAELATDVEVFGKLGLLAPGPVENGTDVLGSHGLGLAC